MDTLTPDSAITYLNGVGPRSNLGKIRHSLEALEDSAPGDEWSSVMCALDEADAVCDSDSGEDADTKTDARETLEGAIEDLLTAIEDTQEVTASVTAMAPAARESELVKALLMVVDLTAQLERSRQEVEMYRRCYLTARTETPAVTKLCACGCGQPITSPRPEARYATGTCRVRAHRTR